MPKLVQIQYVKCDKANPHLRVRYVGGMNSDGTRWKLSEDVAIAGIKQGKWRFWTACDKKSVWVIAAKSASGREYLKAETDWVQPVTLLALHSLFRIAHHRREQVVFAYAKGAGARLASSSGASAGQDDGMDLMLSDLGRFAYASKRRFSVA